MIKHLYLNGFKCFKEAHFEFNKITLLSGLNSSGKSSLLQAIRMLYEKNKVERLGIGKDVVSDLARKCEVFCKVNEEISIKMSWERDAFFPTFDGNESFCDKFSYISASRLGPELELPYGGMQYLDSVGEHGEFVFDLIEKYIDLNSIPASLKKDNNSDSVFRNIGAWLDIISPGITLEYDIIQQADRVIPKYSNRRSTNVGFGLSYALPIIANLLIYAALVKTGECRSPLVLIENPEAHLHPQGQTQMGILLALAAQAGVQVILETHSDHLLNGIRLAVKEKKIDYTSTAFYFFSYDFEAQESIIENPVVDKHGFFDEWPSGFFDEYEKILLKLI